MLFVHLCLARISSVTSAVSCPLSVLVVSRGAVALVCCFLVFPFFSLVFALALALSVCWMDPWLNQEFVIELCACQLGSYSEWHMVSTAQNASFEAIIETNQR